MKRPVFASTFVQRLLRGERTCERLLPSPFLPCPFFAFLAMCVLYLKFGRTHNPPPESALIENCFIGKSRNFRGSLARKNLCSKSFVVDKLKKNCSAKFVQIVRHDITCKVESIPPHSAHKVIKCD